MVIKREHIFCCISFIYCTWVYVHLILFVGTLLVVVASTVVTIVIQWCGFAVRFTSFRHGGRGGRCTVWLARGLDWWDANHTLVVVVVVVIIAGVGTIDAATARFDFVGSFRFFVGSFDVFVVGTVIGNGIVKSDFHHVAIINDSDNGLFSYFAEAIEFVPPSIYTASTNLGPIVVRGGHRKCFTAYETHDDPVISRTSLIELDATTWFVDFDFDVVTLQTKR